MRILTLLAAGLAMTCRISSAGGLEAAGPVTALTGVAVIDVKTGTIAAGQTVVIHGDRIAYVGNEPSRALISKATVYDHSGRFVIPGLWDMHVHIRNGIDESGPNLASENATWLRQYLGFGITAVRDAGGDLPDEVLEWRKQIEQGKRQGPRIFTSLRKIDGPNGGWPGSIRISSQEDVEPAIDALEQAGADFIKLYDGSLDGQRYLQGIAEAERRGLRTAGHLPLSVDFEDAIDAGLDSVEHDLYLVKAASSRDREISTEVARAIGNGDAIPYTGTLARYMNSADPAKMNRVFDKMKERGSALTPTLHIRRVLSGLTDASVHEADAQLAQVPAGIRRTYDVRVSRAVARSPEAVAQARALAEANLRILKVAANRGVMILAGSDSGAGNSFVYPGESLHRELSRLVDAGLTPLEALQAATVNAAKWMGATEQFGTVASGRKADMLILQKNPLDDIRNTQSLVAVIQDGRYLDAPELARLRTLPNDKTITQTIE